MARRAVGPIEREIRRCIPGETPSAAYLRRMGEIMRVAPAVSLAAFTRLVRLADDLRRSDERDEVEDRDPLPFSARPTPKEGRDGE